MALKITCLRTYRQISFIFVISLAFGIPASTQVKDVSFNVNEVINQVSTRHSPLPKYQSQISDLTDEFLIDTNIVFLPALGRQWYPSVACDGTNYLVVWDDTRSNAYDIYLTRVNHDGIILDSAGVDISTASNYRLYLSVAFDGTNYLFVWVDDRNDSIDIYGARVTQSGDVLDPDGIPISTAPNWQSRPSVAFDGTNYLVVWQDQRYYDWNIYGTRVTQTGVVLDTNGIAISTTTGYQYSPALAFDGTNYLVVWQDYRNGTFNDDIYGSRVTQSGIVLDPKGIAISNATESQEFPKIAFDGTNYFVVWRDERSDYWDIYGARVNQSGVVLEPAGIGISTGLYLEWNPSVSFDGTNYLVVWEDRRSLPSDIYGSRVSQDGIVLDTNGIAISTAENTQEFPSVTFAGENYFIVWEDSRNGYNKEDIYGARIDQSGIVLDSNGILISNSVYSEYSPSVAFDGTNYLTVWEDRRIRDTSNIYGTRVSQSGVTLDPNCIAISIATGEQSTPAVAFDSTNYLVVWEDRRTGYSDIYGARVTPTGFVLDPEGIGVSTAEGGQGSPSIAFDGTNYMVVQEDGRNGYSDIYSARVNQEGIVLDPNGIAISLSVNELWHPSIAFDGTNNLVVWTWTNWGIFDSSDIYGVRVSQEGLVLDSISIPISTSEGQQEFPSVAFDGINYFVVWQDNRNGYSDIYGARINLAGVTLDPNGIAIATATNDQNYPSVVFDGTNYLVLWEDHRGGGSYSDIYGARVNPSGATIDSFIVSKQEGSQASPALAHGSGNQVLVTYSGWTGEYQGKIYNTTHIWGKFYPFVPGISEENSKVKIQSTKLLEVHPNPARSFLAVRKPLTKI
jgi:hypothetical protein